MQLPGFAPPRWHQSRSPASSLCRFWSGPRPPGRSGPCRARRGGRRHQRLRWRARPMAVGTIRRGTVMSRYPTNVRHGWRPYYDDGHWAYSDDDWLDVVSDASWGWAPFHYGRWAFDPQYGWVWVPGRVWGPAWESRSARTTITSAGRRCRPMPAGIPAMGIGAATASTSTSVSGRSSGQRVSRRGDLTAMRSIGISIRPSSIGRPTSRISRSSTTAS